MEKEVVYIFVSHSHNDLNKVRLIRNYLESLGAEPILFFLKSKTDEDEIMQLIKDERDARIWFIYCRSYNAEHSKWCKSELEHVEGTGKWTMTIDIENCLDADGKLNIQTKEALNRVTKTFKKLQKLYVSYDSLHDNTIVSRITDVLNKYDIETINPFIKCVDDSFDIDKFVEQTLNDSDYYLLFLSKNSIKSSWVRDEFRYAKKLGKETIVILIYEDQSSLEEIRNNASSTFEGINDLKLYLFDCSCASAIYRSTYDLMNRLLEFIK